MGVRWNIHYEVCALGLLIMLTALVCGRRRVRTLRGNYYAALVLVTLAATAVDLLTSFTLSNASAIPLWINYALNVMCLLFGQLMPVVMLAYLLMVVKRPDIIGKKLALLSTPSMVCSVFIISSPANGLVFYFDEAMTYQHGAAWLWMFTPSLFTMVAAVYYLIKSGKTLRRSQRLALYSFDGLLLCGTLLQATLFEWVLITYLCCAISTLFIYIEMETQDSYIDDATDMAGAAAFWAVAEERALRGRRFAMAVFEISEIDIVEMTHGSPLADKLRAKIAELIKAQYGFHNAFILARTRFCAMGEDLRELASQARLTRSALEKDIILDDRAFGMTARAVVFDCAKEKSVAEILRFADFLLGKAINDARGDALIAGEAERGELKRRDGVQRALHRALDEDALQVYYQPMFDSETRKIICAEALARVFDGDSGIVPSDKLIAIAELDGSIFRVSEQLMRKVFKLIAELPEDSRPEFISMNMNAVQLMQSGFSNQIKATARLAGLDAGCVAVEITESQQLQLSAQVTENILALARDGVRLLLDDFGKGYSNVMSVMTIPFRYVKLDRSIVQAFMKGDGRSLRKLAELLHGAGMKIVAEGIETPEQADQLADSGCDILQGYALARPMPEEEFAELLKQSRMEGSM